MTVLYAKYCIQIYTKLYFLVLTVERDLKELVSPAEIVIGIAQLLWWTDKPAHNLLP